MPLNRSAKSGKGPVSFWHRVCWAHLPEIVILPLEEAR
jgi:hypothetical protein